MAGAGAAGHRNPAHGEGVVVVCEGGDLPQVQQRIIEAVTTALNISSKRVCVTKSS